MAVRERTAWALGHSTACNSESCPCYVHGASDQAVATGPAQIQAGAELHRLRSAIEAALTEMKQGRDGFARQLLEQALSDRPEGGDQ